MGGEARIPVGTHYRVWWFWLPVIIGVLALLAAAIALPIFPAVGFVAGGLFAICCVLAVIAGYVIERGRRWVELSDDGFRVSDRTVQMWVADQQVTDLAIERKPHHGSGKLLAETRQMVCWIDTEAGTRQLALTSRLAPGAADPLQVLIDRLRRQIGDRATDHLAARESIDGDGWSLDATQLHLSNRRGRTSIPLDEISAIETIGQEVRIWQHDNPYAVARLPVAGRNCWLVERLLSQRLQRPDPPHRGGAELHSLINNPQQVLPELDRRSSPKSPFGRVLFERSAGKGATIVFGAIGLLLGIVGGVSVWVAILGRDPIIVAAGGLLLLLSGLCFAAGWRVRGIFFRAYERGLEKATMTSRRALPFDDVDVFSFESRRNQSQGRYTGTTYTLVFADRSREQGRGIFYSTTVRNQDEELEDLRDRISQEIARRMAQTFAASHTVQWTPEVWFRHTTLEYVRRRRLFVASKVVVIPYDTITDFELRDGLLHLWTSYQERAVLSINAGAPNFYPGLILLEGLARTSNKSNEPLEIEHSGVNGRPILRGEE